MAFISVIIPLYNKENYLPQAIKSVLEQTVTDFEVLVIDDGSTDGSLAVANSYTDTRLFVYSKENQGAAATRNFGIEKAKGRLIAFLDADDYWENNHLEELMRLYSAYPQAGMYAMRYCKVFSEKGKKIAVFKGIAADFFEIVPDYFEASAIDSVASASSIAIRREVFEQVGLFDAAMVAGEDIDLWIRVALNMPVALSGKRTAYYRMDAPGSLSKKILPHRMQLLVKYSEQEKHSISLKKYLDLNRYALALSYKLAGNKKLARRAQESIQHTHLTYMQRVLLRTPRFFLKRLKELQDYLAKRAIFLSPYR